MQHTLAQTAIVEGFGFWTGQDIRVEFHPARANAGLFFVRTDLPISPIIPVSPYFQIIKPRQTSLATDDAQVDMVEHILAALHGLEIDNCEIRVNAPEMPGMDGSSQAFTAAILKAGIITQSAIRPKRIVYKTLRVGDDDRWIEAKPSYNGRTTFVYHLDYGDNNAIPRQSYRFVVNPENFILQLMSCRTFLTKKEADQLLAMGLCRRVSPRDVLVFDENQKPIDNTLLYADECARHKTLDMVGDFSLGACDWIGEFTAYRSGHHLNVECVRELLKKTVYIESNVVSSHTSAFRVASKAV
ncbi:MAG: UDP-3-O-acyl-N-acetylglucosamine deacetylase [Planctomycetaceae bacterium]|jgi:UDP-3-O-acyl N-acetylglucosamine deacetylase|nr:UDP-3-O-acyl-N-acetylglucosamine deacetylase [Planctomycetaceae bacterium]